jgi:hypothetical protein
MNNEEASSEYQQWGNAGNGKSMYRVNHPAVMETAVYMDETEDAGRGNEDNNILNPNATECYGYRWQTSEGITGKDSEKVMSESDRLTNTTTHHLYAFIKKNRCQLFLLLVSILSCLVRCVDKELLGPKCTCGHRSFLDSHCSKPPFRNVRLLIRQERKLSERYTL